MSEEKRLFRSASNRMVGGVCSGLGQYFGVDPVLVRLIFVALGLVNGLGVVIYLVMWILVPDESMHEIRSEDAIRANLGDIEAQARRLGESVTKSSRGSMLIGGILVVLGGLFMLHQFVPGLSLSILGPLALIIVGAFILFARR